MLFLLLNKQNHSTDTGEKFCA